MKRKTNDAIAILDSMIGTDVKSRARIEEFAFNAKIAQTIFQARTARGLTQKQLAGKIGTTQPVIARLEDASYEGHSLAMLRRIADALGKRIEIRLAPAGRRRARKAVA